MMPGVGRGLILSSALLACACAHPPDDEPKDAGIDHIILGSGDLDSAIVDMERRTGVRPVYGGAHPGSGTRNALMSLGPSLYLEILAPDPAQHVDDPERDALLASTSLKPVGWAVHTSDAEALRRRLRARGVTVTAPKPGSRARPDGTRVEWTTFAVTKPEHVLAPFFIRWADMALHPSRTSPRGCAFRSLTLSAPDRAPLEAIVGPLHLPVRVSAGAGPGMSLALSCPRGEVVFH